MVVGRHNEPAAGKILEINDRFYRIDMLHHDDDGNIAAITAFCLNPAEEDDGPWWSLEVTAEALLVAHTVH